VSGVSVFIDPFSQHFEQDRLFDRSGHTGASDNALAPYVHLSDWLGERGVEVHTADLMDAVGVNGKTKLYFSFGMRHRYSRLSQRTDVVLSGLFAFECPIVDPKLYRELRPASRLFKRVFSYSTAEALAPFLTGPVDLESFRLPQFFEAVHEGIWERRDRKFLVMINGNKIPRLSLNELYSERLQALAYFDRFGEVDLYGVGWDGPAYHVGETWIPGSLRAMSYTARKSWRKLRPRKDPVSLAIRSAYRGRTDHKAATLGGYTFALCFENSALEGWVTEKIFDCFFAGTVPVYWGAPDVERWVPSECFIDMRRFSGYEDLRTFLRDLSPSEIEAYREAAREYLQSERYRPFTKQAFAELIGEIVAQDAGIRV
jgi:alpha(1,3/1,4) fucosyltransferase